MLTPARTRTMKAWPFPVSVLRNGAVVRNVPPTPKKPKRLKRVRPPNLWQQESLL